MQMNAMPTYDDLVELARICREQARATKSAAVVRELRSMAKDYQERAAKLAAVKLADVGVERASSVGGRHERS